MRTSKARYPKIPTMLKSTIIVAAAFISCALPASINAQVGRSRAILPQDLSAATAVPIDSEGKAVQNLSADWPRFSPSVADEASALEEAAVVWIDLVQPEQAVEAEEENAVPQRSSAPQKAVAAREEFDDAFAAEAGNERERARSGRHDDRRVRCVAQAVYHEARGEPMKGQLAVADVVVNRARSGRWGSDVCDVVNAPYQFSGRNRWQTPRPGVPAWDRAINIAKASLAGETAVSSRIMNFRHARMGSPARNPMKIGNHLFW